MKHSVREVELKNGAKGLLIHVPQANVMSFELDFRAGSFLSSVEKIETAHIMEHLMFGANAQYKSAIKFSHVFEQNGAYSNASTGPYNVGYEAECADFEWDRILDLLLVSIGKPLFLEHEFDAEFGNVKEELAQRSNNHIAVLGQKVRRHLGFADYTYKLGEESLKNISLDDVRAHYKKTHFTRNMRFIVAGDVHKRTSAIIKKLESINLPEGDQDRIELPDENTRNKKTSLFIKNASVPNLYFSFDSLHSKRISEAELDAANVANSILNEGYTSRIFGKAREKGLVYDISSTPYYSKNISAWGIDGQVSRANAPALFELMADEIKKIAHRQVSLGELSHAKKRSIGGYYRGAQTVGSLLYGYGAKYFWDDSISSYDTHPERVNSVTRARIKDVMQKLLSDEDWLVSFLGTSTEAERSRLCSTMSTIWQ